MKPPPVRRIGARNRPGAYVMKGPHMTTTTITRPHVFDRVPSETFRAFFELARSEHAHIAESTSPFEMTRGASCFLSTWTPERGVCGFVIRADGELTNVFSVGKGNGDDIMRAAIARGARHLDCFDGYLPTFYGRHGFAETRREDNWTPGGPAVVYMALSA